MGLSPRRSDEEASQGSSLNGRALFRLRRWRALAFMLVAWLLISFALVLGFTRARLTGDLRRRSTELDRHAEAAAQQFDRSIAFLYGVPSTVADDPEVIGCLLRTGPGSAQGAAALRARPDLSELNHHLATVCRELGIDIAWILSAQGVCLATSNFDRPESFLGIEYSDRSYFRMAMAGRRGRQYAVGRTTNIPGFYFSAPIEHRGVVLGAVVAKIDVPRLSEWFKRFDCFITDEAGVIILSSDASLNQHAISGAAVFQLAPAAREKTYKRAEFSTLAIGRIDPRLDGYESALFPGNSSPFMVASRPRTEFGYSIHAFTKVPEAERTGVAALVLGMLVFTAGAALLIMVTGFRNYLHHLQEAMAASEAASRSKSEFLATMSHEIRTPMNGIIGLARLVSETPLNEEQTSYVGALKTSADNLLRILNDILDFSKIESGRVDFESVAFSLRGCLRAILDTFQAKAVEQGVALELDIDEGVPDQLQGDPGRLSQVLTNLLGNALKFTHRGRVTLACRSAHRPETHVLVTFSVMDTGIGIPAKQLSRIFDQFTQADSSTTRLYGGTGLGLAISQRLTELMGGRILVESTPGQGSVFSFDLPFARPEPGELINPQPSEPIFQAPRLLNILVVDDVPINQLVAKKTIARTGGHQIDCASNGLEAVERCGRESFDLIFMDVQMPGMDGLAATRAIRARERQSGGRVHICAMTANAMKEDKTICEDAGMDSYIAKPILAEDVNAIIKLLTSG